MYCINMGKKALHVVINYEAVGQGQAATAGLALALALAPALALPSPSVLGQCQSCSCCLPPTTCALPAFPFQSLGPHHHFLFAPHYPALLVSPLLLCVPPSYAMSSLQSLCALFPVPLLPPLPLLQCHSSLKLCPHYILRHKVWP